MDSDFQPTPADSLQCAHTSSASANSMETVYLPVLSQGLDGGRGGFSDFPLSDERFIE